MITIHDKCICKHKRYDHYGIKYNSECVHRMGVYTNGIKCACLGFTQDNLVYLEQLYTKKEKANV